MRNKLTKTDRGYVVENNYEDIEKGQLFISEALDKADISNADAVTALLLTMVEVASFLGIKKAHVLAKVSSYWEQISPGVEKINKEEFDRTNRENG